MPWFRLEDSWHSHPKVIEAGNAAAGLWVRCCTYSAQYLTDGFINDAAARRLGTAKEIAAVTAAGLWREVDGGFQVDGYLEYNPSSEAVKRDRAAATERQRRAREAAAAKRVTPMSRRDMGVSHGDVTDMSRSPRPDPTRITNTPSDFASFWLAYPRKVGKGNALAAWKKLKPPIDDVLRAIEIQTPTWTDPKFIPHPATWLNGRRWEDELPVQGRDTYRQVVEW